MKQEIRGKAPQSSTKYEELKAPMYRSRKVKKEYNPQKIHKRIRSGEQTCPFCDLTKNNIVLRSKYHTVVKNIYGYQYWEFMDVVDHLMIVPKRHVESISELDDEEQISLMKLIAQHEKKGYNIYAREQNNAMKSIPHQHTHLIKTKNKRASFFFYLTKPYTVIKK